MADTRKSPVLILAVGFSLLMILTVVEAGLDSGQMGLIRAGSGLDGTVGSFLDLEDEFMMDTESHRRILATSRYISYGALNKNRVPCSRRGASYYNCRPGGQANPYSRGCSAITRCSRR